jgi:hypothetical protein
MIHQVITICLDTKVEQETFAAIMQGLVMKGLTFDCVILGTKATITLTGGF